MLSIEHHAAQKFSSDAMLAMQDGNAANARRLYKKAAKLEAAALKKVEPREIRTQGILAVSLVAMLLKAGLKEDAETEARRFLVVIAGPNKLWSPTACDKILA